MAMVRNNKAISAASRRAAPRLTWDISELVHSLTQAFSDSYRPELHYMRGPGPKWQAKHGPAQSEDHSVPALARADA